MNSNGRFWEIGLKILAAAVVGIAVFVGIEKSTSKENNNFNGSQQNPDQNNNGNNNWTQPEQQQEAQNNTVNQKPENKVVGEKVVDGLNGIYRTFGKLSQVISSLVDVVGSIGRLFGNDNNYGYPPRQPFYTSNPWGCGCNLGPGLHRVNDYIIQVGPTQGQQYGNNFGYC